MLCAGVEMERCEVGILRQACDPDAKSGVSWHSHCTEYREGRGSTVQHGCNVLKMHENAENFISDSRGFWSQLPSNPRNSTDH